MKNNLTANGLRRMGKFYLPIWWYFVLFMAMAIVPAGISAYLSVEQADSIQKQAEEQSVKRAQEELRNEVAHIGQELIEVAQHLAGWDETLALFRDATYYNYWKETRVSEVARYRGLINGVDLYSPNGRPITPDFTMTSAVYKAAIQNPTFLKLGEQVYVVYFHPIVSRDASNPALLGYIGVRMDVNEALRSFNSLEGASILNIDWRLPTARARNLLEGVSLARLQVKPSPEIHAFSKLARNGFMQSLGYIVILLVLLSLLLWLSIARPLRRLTNYLNEIKTGSAHSIPEGMHGVVPILELENVRRSLNDYKDKLQSAAVTLEEKNRELLHLTYHDMLTGRHNRRAFESRVQRAIESAIVNGKQHALFYIDVDQFKVVNDTCGHVAGDELLKQVAALLASEIRESDMLARLGGDEFGVLLDSCFLEKAFEHAETMRLKVRKHRFIWEETPFDISISIGLVTITPESSSMEEVLKNADAACYVAKDSGRNRTQVYQPQDQEVAQRYGEMQWVSRVQYALDENRFELHGQLIRPAAQKTYTPRYEVLVRMRDTHGSLISPMAFIPAAERYHLMQSIDRWVIQQALKQLSKHLQAGGREITLSINLSGQSLGNHEVLTTIQSAIKQSGVAPESLCFEITETAAISNLASASHFIQQLREMGCCFSLDDFGSGLSSFGYLSNLEVDYIKIDGHFVRNILVDPLSRSIVDAINRIGHVMGIRTIAEFVESQEVAAALQTLGIDFVQGAGIHKPEPLERLLDINRSSSVVLAI